jgi:hypothetical protein
MSEAPKTIYLQYDPDGETTWCEDRINDEDIEYVQAGELEAAKAIIIEADAQYNINKIPVDFATASIALVSMAAHGSLALVDVAWMGPEIERQTTELQQAREAYSLLQNAAANLISYRARIGPLSFQLEKMDDYIRELAGAMSDPPEQE